MTGGKPTKRSSTRSAYGIEISTVIAAQPQTIFRFFANPDLFSQWLAAKATFEPRVGSPLRIAFPPHADCPDSVMQGEILAFEPNRRIVFSWGYAPGTTQPSAVQPGSTEVELTLQPHDDGTLVTLIHRGLPSEKDRQEHEGGWKHYVCQLSLQSTQAELSGLASASVEKYLSAWNADTAEGRRTLLDAACQPQVELVDRHALVHGVAELDRHIEGARRMLRGVRLELASGVELCHAYVRFGWKCTDPSGSTLFQGTNFGTIATDGRLKNVVGFWDA